MLDSQLTPKLALAILAATIGGSLTFGYHLACLNAPVNEALDFSMAYHLNKLVNALLRYGQKKIMKPIKEWIARLSDPADDASNAFNWLLTENSQVEKKTIENSSADLSPRCQAKRRAEEEDQSVLAFSILVSIFTIGGMLGGILSGQCADKFGRKRALLYNNAVGFLANLLMFCAAYFHIGIAGYYIFVLGRFIVGINSGANSGLVPIYLTEIAPIHLRGSIASANQLFVTIGVLLATFIGIFFSTSTLWPFIIAFSFLPILFSVVILPNCPESPKHSTTIAFFYYLPSYSHIDLIIERNELAAERSLKALRPRHLDISSELEGIRREADTIRAEPEVTYRQLFTAPALRWPLLVAVIMMVAQQFSGINGLSYIHSLKHIPNWIELVKSHQMAVVYYSTQIFQLDAGFGEAAARWASCIVFLLYVFFTLTSTWLVDRPKFGRRSLVLAGFLGNIIFMFLLFLVLTALNCVIFLHLDGSPWNYLAILFVVLYIASFAAGPGSIPWFYVTEVFHSNARAKASSIVSVVNWSCNFLVGLGFSPLRKLMGTSIFLVFIVLLIIFIIFLFLYAPETKGKNVDEVNEEMRAGRVAFRKKNGHQNGVQQTQRVSVAMKELGR